MAVHRGNYRLTALRCRPVLTLPTPREQAERLAELGVHDIAGLSAAALLDAATDTDALLVIRPDLMPASALAPHLRHGGKPGFVVTDMSDVDEFAPIDCVALPHARISGSWPRPGRRDGQLESR